MERFKQNILMMSFIIHQINPYLLFSIVLIMINVSDFISIIITIIFYYCRIKEVTNDDCISNELAEIISTSAYSNKDNNIYHK